MRHAAQRWTTPPIEAINQRALEGERTHIIHGYGMVGTGHTREEARRDLLEKIRQAGEA